MRLLRDAILNVEGSLRERTKGYIMRDARVCAPCDLTFGGRAEYCPCGQYLRHKYCTVDSRVSEYFFLLRRHGLYPVDACSTCSLHEIGGKIRELLDGHGHDCEGQMQCPFTVSLSRLRSEMESIGTAVGFVWTCD